MDTLPRFTVRILEVVAVALVLGLFFFGLRSVLNPLILFFVLWAVLLPFRGSEVYGALLGMAAALTLLWVLSTTGSLLAPFVLALVLAYMLDPMVDWLGERGIPRIWGIVVLTLPAVGILALILFVAIPSAVQEIGQVLQRLPELASRAADWLERTPEHLMGTDFPLLDEEAVLARLRAVDQDTVVNFLDERQEALAQWAWEGLLGVGRGLGAIVGILTYVVLTPVLTFYLLRDWDRLTSTFAGLIPEHRREASVEFLQEYDQLLARYLRGQATVALSIGAITALGLWVTGFPYAATLGLIVAVFSVVPYLGLLLSLLPAIVIALVSGSILVSLAKVALIYGIAQGLEGTVISPRIVGNSVGLHPVLVVLALAVGGFFFGFVGLLLAVPGAVGIKLLVQRGLVRYRASALYRGESVA